MGDGRALQGVIAGPGGAGLADRPSREGQAGSAGPGQGTERSGERGGTWEKKAGILMHRVGALGYGSVVSSLIFFLLSSVMLFQGGLMSQVPVSPIRDKMARAAQPAEKHPQ